MPAELPDAADLSATTWDVLVIGTGMGGATLGYALARAGMKVLFCEKGRSHLGRVEALRGEYAETFFSARGAPAPVHADTLRRAGRFAEEMEDVSGKRPVSFIPFIGSGTGGSTALYGMALERFFPEDFTPRAMHLRAEGSSVPDAWPITYEELAPFYDAAEELYRVRGERDPLRGAAPGRALLPPTEVTAPARELVDFLAGKGLHPYRLPVACESVAGCQSCQGYLCPKPCKNDSARICLEPAISRHGAVLLDECEVTKLGASRRSVQTAESLWRGRPLTLRARSFVLAAGALVTPLLLLRSAGPEWPQGLANESGLVGRNLMRHLVDLYLIAPEGRRRSVENRFKEIVFNDFYRWQGQKLGSVQSFGRLPPPAVMYDALLKDVADAGYGWLTPLVRLGRPIIGRVLDDLADRRLALASTLEDLPYAENQVLLPTATGRAPAIRYRIQPYERERIRVMRDAMRNTLRPYRFSLVKQAEHNQRLAHACGTCRFGTDPTRSVLDPHCRAHGVENLYVADSSFFPSSGGTNPSLTIAANALRVAARLTGASQWDRARGG